MVARVMGAHATRIGADMALASAGIGWPGSRPDLLELELFDGVWNPAS
ncbi:hypothetical protein [Streptomyces sp. NPDC050982]